VAYPLEKGQNNIGWFPFNIVPNPTGGNNAPQATSSAQPRTRDVGTSVTFTASFTGTPTPTFRWRRNGVNLSDGKTASGSVISGARTGTLTISNLQVADAGDYSCRATNACGSRNSPTSVLTVIASCAGDFNLDGLVNSQDFFDFLTLFFALDPASDFNHDGNLNSQDFFDFVTAFFNCQ
jgi:hypothetical protein